MRNQKASRTTSLIIFALFIVSLRQFSLEIAEQGVSANYVYVLIPFIFCLMGIKRRLVGRQEVFLILLIYTLIYFLGLPEDIFQLNNNINNPIRRMASFLVFLCPFFLSFVEFKPGDIGIFKTSVIIVSVFYSLGSILAFVSLSSPVGLYSLKDVTGSQRYGFILCLAFFISLFNDKLLLEKWIQLQRVIICSIIFLGLIFTFSRASVVSVAGGLVFCLASGLFKKNHRIDSGLSGRSATKKVKPIYLIATLASIVFIFIAFQGVYGINLLEFYQTRLIDPLADSRLMEGGLEEDPASSEGFRVYLLNRILDYLAVHPFFGSSYQGLYLLYDEFKDGVSTHNQYTDVFLRTGLVGGALWLFLLYRIFRFCSRDKGLQVGLVSILIYGLFHETFKESQGSFVFAMLLSFSYMSWSLRRRNVVPHNAKQSPVPSAAL